MKTMSVMLQKIPAVAGLALVTTIALPTRADSKRLLPNNTTEIEIPYRSPGLALSLSLLTTGVLFGGGLLLEEELPEGWGNVLALTGATVGPATGLFYTGKTLRGVLTSFGRFGALGLAVLGGFAVAGGSSQGGADEGLGAIMLLVGGAGWLSLTIWDIKEAKHSAERFNQEARALALSPLVLPPVSGSPDPVPAYGLALSGRF